MKLTKGNYIKQKGYPEIYTIDAIMRDNSIIGKNIVEPHLYRTIKESSLEGVKITTDRLIDLGFEEYDEDYIKNNFFIYKSSDKWIVNISGAGDQDLNVYNKEYIHELQELFSAIENECLTFKK